MTEHDRDENGARRTRDRTTQAPQDSSIRMILRRSATNNAASAETADAERATLEAISKVFVREGREYRFPDGAAAFVDQGNRLTSQSENLVVVRALVDIAVARDWQSLAVSGTDPFRKAVWTEASVRGLEIKGYTPTEAERSRVGARVRAAEVAESEDVTPVKVDAAEHATPVARPARARRPIEGTLLEHGRAPYKGDADNAMSYFARLRTAGKERTVWGVDLERALRESVSAPKVGDDVVVRQLREDPVTVKTVERGEGDVVRETSRIVTRNRWSVETRAFVEERLEASKQIRDRTRDPKDVVRDRPELAGAYLGMRGAQEIARTRIPHPEDQTKFVDLVRTAIADGVKRGEPLPTVKLRDRGRDRPRDRSSPSGPVQVRDDPEVGR